MLNGECLKGDWMEVVRRPQRLVRKRKKKVQRRFGNG